MRVLVVDDDADIRRLLRILLEERGHETIEAANGSEGLDAARTEQPAVVICDGMMPVMHGLDFLCERQYDSFLSAVPVVLFDSNPDRRHVLNAVELGADAVVIKGWDTDDLIPLVEHLAGLDADLARVRPYLAGTLRATTEPGDDA